MDDETKARIDRLIAAQESLVLVIAQLADAIAQSYAGEEPEPEDRFGSLDG